MRSRVPTRYTICILFEHSAFTNLAAVKMTYSCSCLRCTGLSACALVGACLFGQQRHASLGIAVHHYPPTSLKHRGVSSVMNEHTQVPYCNLNKFPYRRWLKQNRTEYYWPSSLFMMSNFIIIKWEIPGRTHRVRYFPTAQTSSPTNLLLLMQYLRNTNL
jgi:hypothetical protein